MKKIVTPAILLFALFFANTLSAQQVTAVITTDDSFGNKAVIEKISKNLSKTLTEINKAHKENRPLNIVGLPMSEDAKDALLMLWANIHFYCDDEEVVERCWVFNDGEEFMVSHIPLIITVDGDKGFGNGTYQEAVIDFDRQGRIKDFRFSLDAQLSESMENCGGVVDMERKMKILSYCERFRTAYSTKDLDFLKKVFSDDALIITGNVTMVSDKDTPYSKKAKVTYKKQNKQQYLANLEQAFLRNKWIEVKFTEIGENGEEGGCPGITRSVKNPNCYGVRLRQEWKSSNYNDVGYLFLLWDFSDENKPMIHVRTWQPAYAGAVEIAPDNDILSLGAFDL